MYGCNCRHHKQGEELEDEWLFLQVHIHLQGFSLLSVHYENTKLNTILLHMNLLAGV